MILTMWMIFIAVNIIATAHVTVANSNVTHNSSTIAAIVERLLRNPDYNKRVRPDAGGPLDLYININVNDISSISEIRMDYQMTLFLREIWKDHRLSYTDYDRNITLNYNQFDRIWSPDVFIRNLKAGEVHQLTVPNRLIRLSPDGTILYSQRLTVTLSCKMLLMRYPMDNQTCFIEFGSYAYSTDDLLFHWRFDAPAVEMSRHINLPAYLITNVTNVICSAASKSVGTFPCLRAYFHLDRRLRSYMLTTYLPSFLVVLLSWLSFWIDFESAPARTSLAILTILTITTQTSALLQSTPAAAVTKAIDIWMATCLVFVFGAFIEYSVVSTLARRHKEEVARKKKTEDTFATLMAPAGFSPGKQQEKEMTFWEKLRSNKAVMVESLARVIFPTVFLIFNFIYWPSYLIYH